MYIERGHIHKFKRSLSNNGVYVFRHRSCHDICSQSHFTPVTLSTYVLLIISKGSSYSCISVFSHQDIK